MCDDESLSMRARTNRVCVAFKNIEIRNQKRVTDNQFLYGGMYKPIFIVIGCSYAVTRLEENASSLAWESDLGWSANASIHLGTERQLFSINLSYPRLMLNKK